MPRVLSGSGGVLGPNRLRLSEIVLRTLLDAGFGPREAAYAGLLLNDYVVTFALEEAQAASVAGSPSEAASAGAHSRAESLPPDRYPSMIALAAYLGEPDLDERFWFGVEILRSGLERLLARSKA
jgi:TetR/AcrR family tetracycline transcriptional repressor